jgi:hypothetical protein
MPILGVFRQRGCGIPVESVKAFESALKELGKNASIHIYRGRTTRSRIPRGRTIGPSRRGRMAEDARVFADHLKS